MKRPFLVAAGLRKTSKGLEFTSGCARIFHSHTRRGALLQMRRSLRDERALGWTIARVTIEEWK